MGSDHACMDYKLHGDDMNVLNFHMHIVKLSHTIYSTTEKRHIGRGPHIYHRIATDLATGVTEQVSGTI